MDEQTPSPQELPPTSKPTSNDVSVAIPKPETAHHRYLIAAALILLAIGLGSWIWHNQVPKLFPTPKTPIADETSDWKTYRNEEYGFEFKYPANWEVSMTYHTNADGSVKTSSGFKISPVGLSDVSQDFISIGGPRMVSLCEDFGLSQPVKCIGGGKESLIPLTYTYSNDFSILKVFDSFLSTFKFIK